MAHLDHRNGGPDKPSATPTEDHSGAVLHKANDYRGTDSLGGAGVGAVTEAKSVKVWVEPRDATRIPYGPCRHHADAV